MRYLKDIQGTDGDSLAGKRIALAMTGSVACIETPRLCRSLMRQGADVFVVMSRAATRLIHPDVMEWSSGNPVLTRLSGRVEHILLAGDSEGRCDAVVVAPATANSIGKLALGIDDTPVTTLLSTAVGSGIPVVVAPGMHAPMLQNPAVQDNLARLSRMGVRLVWPVVAEHKAKMAPVEDIVEAVIGACLPQALAGLNILITAGPTFEYLDPIRGIGNRSSGKLGVALARERLGGVGRVTLVYGPGTAEPPTTVDVRHVETSAQMQSAVEAAVIEADIALFAAAVADYTAASPASDKIPTADGELVVRLVPTAKIIDRARALAPKAWMAGFKAETSDVDALIETARTRLRTSRLQMVVANQHTNFGRDEGVVYLVDEVGAVPLGPASKASLAAGIWEGIIRRRAAEASLA